MKNRKASELNDETLLKQEKIAKFAVYFLSVSLLFILLVQIVVISRKGFNPTIAIPFALIPIVMLNVRNLKELQTEIKKRNL